MDLLQEMQNLVRPAVAVGAVAVASQDGAFLALFWELFLSEQQVRICTGIDVA